MRKLPYNNGDNANIAADKFCIRENLGKGHVS